MQLEQSHYTTTTLRPTRLQTFGTDLITAYKKFIQIDQPHKITIQEFQKHVWIGSQIRYLTYCRSHQESCQEYYQGLYEVIIKMFLGEGKDKIWIDKSKHATVFGIFMIYFVHFTSCERSKNINKVRIGPYSVAYLTRFLQANVSDQHFTYFRIVRKLVEVVFQFGIKSGPIGVSIREVQDTGVAYQDSIRFINGKHIVSLQNSVIKKDDNTIRNTSLEKVQFPIRYPSRPSFQKSYFMKDMPHLVSQMQSVWSQYEQNKNYMKTQLLSTNEDKQVEMGLSKTDRFFPHRMRNLVNNYEGELHKSYRK